VSVEKILTRNQQIEAALHNEAVTRQRVVRLEHDVRLLRETRESLSRRGWAGFWRRLQWLNSGR
jgi:hypothetical protein